MTEAQHTPGPWSFQPSESGDVIWIGNEGENAACVPGYADHPGNIADARLIAAAPDMLACLIEIRALITEAGLTGFNCHEGDWAERLFATQAASHAAVRKATGA